MLACCTRSSGWQVALQRNVEGRKASLEHGQAVKCPLPDRVQERLQGRYGLHVIVQVSF